MDIKLPFFSRGEISPRMAGRVDTAAYQSGLKTGLNAIVDVMGGVMNRPGTIKIGTTKYFDEDKPSRLVSFAFNTSDTHMLEFGDRYMRVIREDFIQLSLLPCNITNITSNGTALFVFHDGAHPPVDGQEVQIDEVRGMTQINDGIYLVADASANAFTLKSKYTGAYFNPTTWGAYTGGGVLDTVYEIETPYAAADLKSLDFAQSADIMFLTHTKYPPMELRRHGLANWEMVQSAFDSTGHYPLGISAAAENPGSVTVEYQVTAIDDETEAESLPGLSDVVFDIGSISLTNPVTVNTTVPHSLLEFDEVFLSDIVGTEELNNRRVVAVNVDVSSFDLRGVDGTDYTAYVSGGHITPTFTRITDGNSTPDATISWAAVDGSSRYAVYKSENGIFGFIGETAQTSFTDDNINADTIQQPPQQTNLFKLTGDYPGAIGFYQQRKVMGGSDREPDTWRASQPGDYNNFTHSTPTKDDDAITATLTSGMVNQIKHFITFNSLGVFTSGQEWTVNSGGEIAFSPFTVNQTAGTNWGISEHRPYMIGGTIIFIQEDNRTVRSYTYENLTNSFKSVNLSMLSQHLFDDHQIRDWALARTPYSGMVLTRTDGAAAMMVYNEEQSVIGWTPWDTQGVFENVASVRVCLEPETPEPDDGIYFTVRRKTANGWVRFIERLHKRRFADVRDAFFVDCGVTYDDPMQITDISVDPVTGALIITAPDHGFLVNEPVDFSDILWSGIGDLNGNVTQPAQLNDTKFIVAGVAGDTFYLKTMDLDETPITASYFGTYYPYISGGVVRLNVDAVDGLDHLDNLYVSVLADGYPLRGQVVTNGKVTLPGLASRIHVGLSYRTDVETLNIEPQMGSNTIQAKPKRINKIYGRFDKSRELLIGYDKNNLNPLKKVPFQTGFVGLAPILYSGDREITMPPDWNGNGRVFFRMLDPLPFTLLAIFPELI